MAPVPPSRIRALNASSPGGEGRYVLYWMIAFRRPRWNLALQRAVELANELGRPLLVLEALRCDYDFASARFHRFILDGMADHAAAFGASGVTYFPYVEPARGAGRGLLAALARDAAAVVTDDHPDFFYPRMLAAAARDVPRAFEAVDSNGMLPIAEAGGPYASAFAFRHVLQRAVRPHLLSGMPLADPLAALRGSRRSRGSIATAAVIPEGVLDRWPAASRSLLAGGVAGAAELARLPIDHAVIPVARRGGYRAATAALAEFVSTRLARYGENRNHPDEDAASGLSPWLHFGHIAPHEVFAAIAARENWDPSRVAARDSGKRAGWWGMSGEAEAFLDQLVTWRELGLVECARDPGYRRYESLPAWARATLEKHAGDPRPARYRAEELEGAATGDALWNAAQRELVRDGRIHNYLRMLWGKRILEWSPGPRHALELMIHLNDKYALDGRDPNSCSGITWVMGRYDRPWGPERPVFGTVRYLSSQNTARKLRVTGYLRRFAE